MHLGLTDLHVRHHRRRDCPRQHPQERNALHATHAGRDAILAADVPDKRVLRGRVKRALQSHQQNRRNNKRRGMERETRDANTDNRDFRPLGELEDAPLGEDDREPVRKRRAKDERQHQRPGRHAHEDGTKRRVPNPPDDDEARQRFQKIVVHRPEQVRDEKRNERISPHRPFPFNTRFRYSK